MMKADEVRGEAPDVGECEMCAANAHEVTVRYGFDGSGPYGSMECQGGGCQAHVSVRPGDRDGWDLGDLVGAVVGFAEAEGWDLDGRLCMACADRRDESRERHRAYN